MKLLAIAIDDAKNWAFRSNPECVEILNMLPAFYDRVGYHPPWIGYFAEDEDGVVVGSCGFKGRPTLNGVEIAYGTFTDHRRKGVATEMCRQLVRLALLSEPGLRVTARTLPVDNESGRVLKRNGFVWLGMVRDEEDGDVWEWEFRKVP